jgi:hypothetical protein
MRADKPYAYDPERDYLLAFRWRIGMDADIGPMVRLTGYEANELDGCCLGGGRLELWPNAVLANSGTLVGNSSSA